MSPSELSNSLVARVSPRLRTAVSFDDGQNNVSGSINIFCACRNPPNYCAAESGDVRGGWRFTHLGLRLRQRSANVIGVGEMVTGNAPDALIAAFRAQRGACCRVGRDEPACWRGFPREAFASGPDAQPTDLRQ